MPKDYTVIWMDSSNREHRTTVRANSKEDAEDIVERNATHDYTLPENRWERHISTIEQ